VDLANHPRFPVTDYTDGYVARFYTRTQLASLIEDNGLNTERVSVLGQTSELLQLPGKGLIGRLKYGLVARILARLAESALRRTGSFLFAVARKS
jgi:hypothetical protein